MAGNPAQSSDSNGVQCETNHEDTIHDSQWDYYGRFLATCSSDRTIRVFTVGPNNEKPRPEAVLTGHEGPVWMVTWAHPRFGTALASCSYDSRVIVWKGANGWKPIHIVSHHKGSVNAVQFAPHEYGLVLAHASSDGFVAVTSFQNGHWRESVNVSAAASHPLGAMAVSFAPYHLARADGPLLASGGCDAKVRLWQKPVSSNEAAGWSAALEFCEHKDWVRDVAFNPNASAKFLVLASCGNDKTVVIRRIPSEGADLRDKSQWEISSTVFTENLWRLSWSPCGTMLLVTAESQSVVLRQGASFTDEWTRLPLDKVA